MTRLAQELRTFRRPDRVEVSPPAVGAHAPPTSLYRNKDLPVVIGFLRHCGCPFAEKTLEALRSLAEKFRDVRFTAVSHADEKETNAWVAEVGGAGHVHVVCDPARHEYNAWGVGISDLSHFLGGSALLSVIELLPQGIKNRAPAGSRWQMAGTFAADRTNIVRFVHLPLHAGDLPDFERAVGTIYGSK